MSGRLPWSPVRDATELQCWQSVYIVARYYWDLNSETDAMEWRLYILFYEAADRALKESLE